MGMHNRLMSFLIKFQAPETKKWQVLHRTATYVGGIFPSIWELAMGRSWGQTRLEIP